MIPARAVTTKESLWMPKPWMPTTTTRRATAASVLFILAAWRTAAAADPVLTGKAAFGGWQSDKPGTVRLIRPQDLPAPGGSSANSSRIVPRPTGAVPRVPSGFKIELFADGLSGPRIIRVAPNGDIFVAETTDGRIRVLRAPDGASRPTATEVFA